MNEKKYYLYFLVAIILVIFFLVFGEEIERFIRKKLLNKNTNIPDNEPLLFSERVRQNRDEFIAETKNLGYDLDINPNVLMFFEDYEGAGTFSPSTQNSIGATGFIQILPSTAISLGTTTNYLKSISNIEYQKVWVRKYFEQVIKSRGKLNEWIDVYLAIFYPAAIGKGDSYSLPSFVTAQNAQFDIDKNSVITVSEIKKYFQNRVKLKVPIMYWKYFNL